MTGQQAETTGSSIRCGAAALDITPPPGTHLSGSGMGNHRPAQSVIDPLYASALVFESGGRRVGIVSLDVTVITQDYTDRIRADVAARCGIEPDALMVHALQTHSAPSIGHFMLDPDFPLETDSETEYLRGAETPYSEFAADRAVQAVEKSVQALHPVAVGVGHGIVGDISFNRRGVRRDGTIMMPKPCGRNQQPLGLTDLCYLEGPIDPEVGVLCVRDADMSIATALLHFTCHPVNVFGQAHTRLAVSSDWPGTWSAGIRKAYNACTPVVINGCCGNINPWHPFDPDCLPDHRRMGRSLTDMTQRIVHSLSFHDQAIVDWRSDHVLLEYRETPPERRRAVDRTLEESPTPRWQDGDSHDVDPAWFLAASTRSIDYCRKRAPQFPYEIQVLRIGDTAIVGLPGEPFVEGQLAIKTASPARHTFVAHMVSHYVGYLPHREAYQRGGHEANAEVTYWAKFAPGSLENVVDRARELVRELFPDGNT